MACCACACAQQQGSMFEALSDMELLTERDFGLGPDSEDSFCFDGLFTTD